MALFNLGIFQSKTAPAAPKVETQAPKASSITSKLAGVISAPFYGVYYAGKGVYQGAAFTGRTIYAIGHETYTFPDRLKRAELGPMLLTAGAITAFTLQNSIALTSPAGVAGSVLSVYLAANMVYGIAIPTVIIGSGMALFEHFKPGAISAFTGLKTEQAIDWIRVKTRMATPQEISAMKATTQANIDAAKAAAMEAAKAEAAKAQLEQAQAEAAKTQMNAKPTVTGGVYSKLAAATGVGLNFVGEGVIAIGEGTTEAGLTATEEAFELDEKKAHQLRIATKVTSTTLAALATLTIASKTGLNLSFVAAPLLISFASVGLDLASGSKADSKAHKAIKEAELNKIAKDEGEKSKFSKAHAGAALAKGVLLETVGNTTSNLGLGLIQSHGGMLLTVGSSFASRTFMPSVAANLYGQADDSSYLDKISQQVGRLYNQGQSALKLKAKFSGNTDTKQKSTFLEVAGQQNTNFDPVTPMIVGGQRVPSSSLSTEPRE